jgi:hypothetical protein
MVVRRWRRTWYVFPVFQALQRNMHAGVPVQTVMMMTL